ncbi:sacsin N-terminal ATP-binding-like domain-containing protein [Hyunsoonleella jejuensis]|nr:sensor histidine kinase [Hyunsoonleella jejuensis]
MINYTEQLKKYWKSKDLAFIATFKRFNKNAGFFNHFTNPISRMKLYYPEFDGVEVLDKRVSFYYSNSSTLSDGSYYKVELGHTDNPKGKNNPFSLEIKSVSELNQNKVEKLLSKKNPDIDTGIKYIGVYHKTSESFACFENVMFSETGEILMFQGESQKVYVSPNLELKEGSYYQFAFIENEGKLPSAIPNTIEILESNPYQEYIRLRFERLNNPEANKMIANLMREIGKGMYSSKQRMIFELLQNADDAPGKEKVGFHIDINGDYFFVMHDGAPFNKDDIEAITSAAESTKRGDSKKTGYKGIGFKSVFTDSTEVWLKSGGYQFAFLRNTPLFEDFDNFYFSSERYQKYPELLDEDKLKYRNQRLRFNGSTDIPWQVIPIWQNNLPSEFIDSNFNNFNNPVQFALKLGENNIEDYKTAIDNITKRPQFLLFLRNTSKFNARRNGVMVLRKDSKGIIEIQKLKGAENLKFYYTKQTFENIEVSDEAFKQLGIGLKKQSKINDYNEVTYYFTDLEGREIETIPPKLASATETEISFGISLVDNKISPEKEYTNGLPKYSSLFTYLPMEDTRFQLPFLVNADFVPSSDRQRIQGDNPWNKYIMIKVAEKHVATLAYFAQEFLNDKDTNSSYLSLLLKNPLPEDDTAQQIIESYNAKYLEQLENTEIVINDNDQVQLLSDTIIDDSGLIELFGNEIFYDIIDTEKRLPNSNLDANYLKDYDYLDVEVIDIEELAEQITPELCESLGSIIAQRALYEKPELLKWLNKLVKYIPDDFGKIPFIVHNNALFSLERLIDEDDAWLINEHTSQYETLIEELGYHTIQLNLDKYSNIKEFLHSINGYINDKTLAYERIASNANIHKLPVTSKLKLIDFFQNSAFMVGIGPDKYFGRLKLFIDESDSPRPIWQLLSHKEDLEVNSIDKFRIKETEFNGLTDDLKKQLIAKDEIFTSFILDEDLFEEWSQQFDTKNINNYVSDLKAMYSWIDNPDDISSAQWASIPWLYVDDEVRFETSDKVYWSKAFKDLSTDKFEIIKTVFQKAELKILPVQECGALIKAFQIKTDDSSDIDWSEVEELKMLEANILLDWMEDDGGFGDFFKNYTIVINTKGNYKIEEIEAIQIFDGNDKALKTYIQSNAELSTLFKELDSNLSSENRTILGLLQGDRLLKALIESSEYDQNLALHLPANVSTAMLHGFITNLNEFKLNTGKEYGSDSPEHIIINNLLKTIDESVEIPIEVSANINELKSKILVNEQQLADFDTSNLISFGKGKIIKGLHLSEVLNEYEGESDILEEIIESFTQITDKRKLRKFIFKTRILEPQEIHYEIEEEGQSFYSVEQVIFQLIDKSLGNNRNWSKKHFDDYYLENGTEEQIHSSYQKFLDILFDLEFTDLSNFLFHDLTLRNCVDKNFAIESEYIPKWLEEWVYIDQVKRFEFLSKLGYNGTDSTIVSMRKYMIATEYEQNTVIRYYEESKPNTQIIWNTIVWLSSYNPNIITHNISVIKQINDCIRFNDGIQRITVPLIKSIDKEGNRIYSLQAVRVETELLKISIQSEFSDSIISSLNKSLNSPNCIDESIGKLSDYFNITTVKLEESADIKTLESKSKLWDEPFYNKWEHRSDYPIYIYDGDEIPYTRSFNGITINTFMEDLKVANDGNYYISKVLKRDILNNLPESFPDNMLSKLKDWHYKTLQNESLLDEDSFDYKEDIDRLLQDRLGISEEDQKRESGNAKTHAVYFLDENGYDVSNVNNAGAALTDIIDPDGNQVNCIVRSAKGGLLYLDKEHWDMMQDDFMYLLAIYPGNSPRLFKNRLELLEEELAENVLFRVPNNKFTSEIDGVFNALESESHLILVTSEKMKESLFSKLKQKSQFNKAENGAVGGDDFKF